MHSLLLSALLPLASAGASLFPRAANFTDPGTVCNLLKQQFANITYLPSDPGYEAETQVAWDASSWQTPACVFAPRNANDLSRAVTLFSNTSTLFAMRGGGHMPIPGAATINSTGVQISSSNLKTLELSEDKQTMSIGPGPRWGDVFQYMDGTNLTIIGGRLPPVGVPGLLLGGGISYFSNAHGLASSEGKIKAYECVLANGTIALVTASSAYSDLYWALQGGGNSFALVTRFDLQTFPLESALRAEATFVDAPETKDLYLDALLDMTLTGDVDTRAAVIPVARWGPGSTVPSYETTLLYNGTEAPSTGPFTAFYNGALESVNASSTMKPLSLAAYAKVLGPAFAAGGPGFGFRQRFRVVSTKATREAMDIVHDTWFAKLQSTDMANRIPGFFAGLAYNSVTRTFAERSQGMPMAIAPIAQFWVEEAVSWSDAADDAEVEQFIKDVNVEIETLLGEKDLSLPYVYLNDANKDQPVFEGYGKENVERLQGIREKYDPEGVFTVLMPGGFKVAGVEVEDVGEDCEEGI
ncbi:FAD-binding domain-containing protein [Amniculicola lignicola CBS 123094]|uniref:FAD-binding domain-containing protein n=1 Tax=Amniculicola lignicola CBS 123094 TaxID=1392246 RepID=A0A6A5W1W2_9PLEO|nr:FAD-binding domain-containing protein [Amniculicola lignicola CBS 123094]